MVISTCTVSDQIPNLKDKSPGLAVLVAPRRGGLLSQDADVGRGHRVVRGQHRPGEDRQQRPRALGASVPDAAYTGEAGRGKGVVPLDIAPALAYL